MKFTLTPCCTKMFNNMFTRQKLIIASVSILICNNTKAYQSSFLRTQDKMQTSLQSFRYMYFHSRCATCLRFQIAQHKCKRWSAGLQIYVGVVYCVFVFVYCIVDRRCSVSGINSDKAHLMAVQGGGHPRSITVLLREQRSRALLYLSFAYIMYKSFSPMRWVEHFCAAQSSSKCCSASEVWCISYTVNFSIQ